MGMSIFWILLIMGLVAARAEVYTAKLRHVDTGKSTAEKLKLGAIRSLKKLAARGQGHDLTYESKVRSGLEEYVMELQLGTPPKNFTAVMDTGSELVWVQCSPSYECSDKRTRNCRHPSPNSSSLLQPSRSSSFSPILCNTGECACLRESSCPRTYRNLNTKNDSCAFYYAYASGEYSVGEYASDVITLTSPSGLTRTHKINIGCSHVAVGDFSNSNGFVGLNLGSGSLISQLPFLHGKFSYCLSHYSKDAHSTLLLGHTISSSRKSTIQSTPLLDITQGYQAHIKSVTVGNTVISRCNASLELNAVEGTNFDTGFAFTAFSPPVFRAIKDAFVDALPGLPIIKDNTHYYDTCFNVSNAPNVKIPSLSIQFHGASFHPPPENYVTFDGDRMCLLLLPSDDEGGTIGNIMQQNYMFSFDTKAMTMSFEKSDCSNNSLTMLLYTPSFSIM